MDDGKSELDPKPKKRKKRSDAGLGYAVKITTKERELMKLRAKTFQKNPAAFRKWAQEKSLFAVQVLPLFFEKPPRGRSSYQAIIGAIREFKELMVLLEENLAAVEGRNKKTIREDSSGS